MKLLKLTVFCLILLAACAQEHRPERPGLPDIPAEPQPEEAPEAPEPVEEETLQGTPSRPASEKWESLFGTRKNGSTVITPADIVCDLDDRRMTFRFTNRDTRTWALDNDLPLAPPEGVVGIRVTLNQYVVNGRQRYAVPGTDEGTYFGPNETFSENCDANMLEPGRTAVCTLQPVPLRNRFHFGGVNELRINPPGTEVDGIVEFSCR